MLERLSSYIDSHQSSIRTTYSQQGRGRETEKGREGEGRRGKKREGEGRRGTEMDRGGGLGKESREENTEKKVENHCCTNYEWKN